jgi:hypothetical protein
MPPRLSHRDETMYTHKDRAHLGQREMKIERTPGGAGITMGQLLLQ